MSPPKPTVGLFAPLAVKPSKTDDMPEFLKAGCETVIKEEPLTLQWFAMKYVSKEPAYASTYALFDTFAEEAGRQAHVTGKVAAAMGAKADELLTAPPEITPVKVLASKVKPIAGSSGATSGLENGLRVFIKAKENKIDDVRNFLINALPLVEAEAETPVWYAIEYPDTNVFGIIDFFANETGRQLHIGGKVAEALFASVDTLLTGAPDLVTVDVIAAKL